MVMLSVTSATRAYILEPSLFFFSRAFSDNLVGLLSRAFFRSRVNFQSTLR